MLVDGPERRLSITVERTPWGEMEARVPAASLTSLALHLSGACTLEWSYGRQALVGRPAGGDMTLVPRGRGGLLRVRGGPCELLKIGIPDAAIAAWVEGCERPWNGHPLLDRFTVNDPLVHQIGLALLREVERPGTVDTIYQDALSSALIAHLVRRHSELEAADDPPKRVHPLSEARARRAVEFMEADLSRTIGLDDIARSLGMSASHFAAQFRARFGRSPGRYLTWLRLDRARVLLETSDLPVAEVGRRVGFTSHSYFTQAFRREFGMTPSRQRRRAL